MKDFNLKYKHLSYDEFFDHITELGNNSFEEKLTRSILIYEDDLNTLCSETLINLKILLKQFKPLDKDLKMKVLEWSKEIQIALANK